MEVFYISHFTTCVGMNKKYFVYSNRRYMYSVWLLGFFFDVITFAFSECIRAWSRRAVYLPQWRQDFCLLRNADLESPASSCSRQSKGIVSVHAFLKSWIWEKNALSCSNLSIHWAWKDGLYIYKVLIRGSLWKICRLPGRQKLF